MNAGNPENVTMWSCAWRAVIGCLGEKRWGVYNQSKRRLCAAVTEYGRIGVESMEYGTEST